MKICTFAGHAKIHNKEEIREKIKKEIINLIQNEDVTIFYSGGKGDFDLLCAYCLDEVKKDYPIIKSYLILPYVQKKKDHSKEYLLNLFDEVIYPNIEKIPPRLAILKRNEWMIDNSDFLIAYVEHSYGGAAKTLEYAKRKNNIIIKNIV